jgi:3-methyladenine DNA glycosylase Tag
LEIHAGISDISSDSIDCIILYESQAKGMAGTGRRHIMIETRIIRKEKKPVAVILDYKEYLKLKEIQEEYEDYNDAVKAEKTTKKWHKFNYSEECKRLNRQ